MDRDDPLSMWLIAGVGEAHPDVLAEHQAAVHAELERLAAGLDDARKRGNMPHVRIRGWGGLPPAQADVERIKDLYRRVLESGGTGRSYVEESLLTLLAATRDPALIPFWNEALDLSRARDTFASRRRALVLSALAFLALRDQELAAFAALRAAAHHNNPQIRALAVHYLGRAYQGYEDMIEFDDISMEGVGEEDQGDDEIDEPADLSIAFLDVPPTADAPDELLPEPAERPDEPLRPVPDDVAAELAEIAIG